MTTLLGTMITLLGTWYHKHLSLVPGCLHERCSRGEHTIKELRSLLHHWHFREIFLNNIAHTCQHCDTTVEYFHSLDECSLLRIPICDLTIEV